METIAPPRTDVEASARRVRVRFGDRFIADSKNVRVVFSGPRHLPAYYFPLADVQPDALKPSQRSVAHPGLGQARYWSVQVGGRTAQDSAWGFPEPEAGAEAIKDHVTFRWDDMDAWFEEDDEVFVHPRDPYTRVDVLHSSRHVKVVVDGVTVAESHRPRLLFETHLPTRYYLPKVDVRLDLLTPSETHTRCPYKGVASYYDLNVNGKTYKDFVWYYPAPLPEIPKIENLLCFYNEKVDLYVDGELEEKPQSPFA
ncbi:MAG TPA: DUF427 domain-containing protein [Candidatus Dormibacteraeota bacterium]